MLNVGLRAVGGLRGVRPAVASAVGRGQRAQLHFVPPVLELPTPQSIRAGLAPRARELVAGHPSLINVPVQWGEQDTFGHLNNVAYMRYFESARLAYFDQVLKPFLPQQAYHGFINGTGIGPIVKSVSVTYRAPVWYPDIITVATRVPPESLKRDRFTQTFVMVSHAQQRVVADGDAVIVLYDYAKGAKTDVPEALLAAYHAGEAAQLAL
ncbi:HotDog domain-containing protein [Entophlyctis helioformis]|nr:HotDog domain-containing protein [Entophlyctis helioformis]